MGIITEERLFLFGIHNVWCVFQVYKICNHTTRLCLIYEGKCLMYISNQRVLFLSTETKQFIWTQNFYSIRLWIITFPDDLSCYIVLGFTSAQTSLVSGCTCADCFLASWGFMCSISLIINSGDEGCGEIAEIKCQLGYHSNRCLFVVIIIGRYVGIIDVHHFFGVFLLGFFFFKSMYMCKVLAPPPVRSAAALADLRTRGRGRWRLHAGPNLKPSLSGRERGWRREMSVTRLELRSSLEE